MKMEYFDAFPTTEIEMVKAGYHLAHIKNRSRFATEDDCARKARLIDFLADEFGTARRIVTVGMSAGGFQSIMFASRYPEKVSFLYLDAPLLTFFSVGTKLFDSMVMGKRWPEIREAYGFTRPIRALTITAASLIPHDEAYEQLDMFGEAKENEKQENLEDALADIRKKFGTGSIHLGAYENKDIGVSLYKSEKPKKKSIESKFSDFDEDL